MRASMLILTVILTLASAACSAEAPDDGFLPFWTEFRQAVIDNNKVRVAAMTRFPFEVLGPDDSDPINSLDRSGFLDIYERLVVQIVYLPSGGQIVSKSMREIIHDTAVAPMKDPENVSNMRFHQFEFEQIGGRWRFMRAYLEE